MTVVEFNTQIIGFQDKLLFFAEKLTANKEDAKDLLQETIMKAILFKDKFVEKTNIKGWLYTIMKNTFINNYRKGVKRKAPSLDNELVNYQITSSHSYEHIEMQHNTHEITKKILNLDNSLRIPFQMYMDGYHYDEIAELQNLPLGTVKSRIFWARKKLMAQLKEYRN